MNGPSLLVCGGYSAMLIVGLRRMWLMHLVLPREKWAIVKGYVIGCCILGGIMIAGFVVCEVVSAMHF